MMVNGYEIRPHADLHGANLSDADLREANLSDADLREANLRGADLTGADLREAGLYGVNLYGANLTGADLRGANLRVVNLSKANLSEANLRGADLHGADLRGANLRGADLPDFQIPQEGELIVYKKLRRSIAKLRVPPEAKRTAALVGRKCRAEYVEVVELTAPDVDCHTGVLRYQQGWIIKPDSYNDDIRLECTHGIHFLLTREEAERY